MFPNPESASSPPPDDPNAATVVRRSDPDGADATRIAPSDGAPHAPAAAPARIGRYELRSPLGRGAMGVVYRAFDTQLKREVALKLVRVQPGETGELVERFRLEAEAAARLRHTNLVAVFDLGEEGGQPFMTMELLEGGSLARLLARRGGRLAPNEAMRLVRDAARGLACAHEKGIVHRDVKPENILLDGDVPKISDFGLAHAVGRPGDARLTLHGTILGTPAYMAPEQAEGDLDRVTARSDVYALGTVLYEAATGAPAYPGNDPMAVILAKLSNDPPAPRGVGRDLETIIRKAMAREPERRYESAGELADDLDRCLAGAAILARPESALEGVRRRIARHRGLAAGSAVVAACLAVAVVAAWRAGTDRKEQKRLEEEALVLLRSVAETNLHASLLLRRAGRPVAEQEPFLARIEKAAREAEARGPASPEPNYRLGRSYRALQRFDDALREQERALAKDATYAPALYERALLDLGRWERRLAELRAAWARDEGRRLAQAGELESVGRLPPPPPDDVLASADAEAGRLRDRIAADLASLERAAPGSADASCLRGLVLLHGATGAERADGARRVEGAIAADPAKEEAYEGLARSAQAHGDAAEAQRQYARGLAADAGYLPFLLGRASVASAEAEQAMAFGGDPIPACGRAEADLTRALEIQPGLAEARLARGRIICLAADRLGESGGRPEPDFRRALEDLTAAVEALRDRAEAWLARGALNATWGHWERDTGGDPRERYALAVLDFDVAVRLAPLSATVWGGRGDVRRHWGQYEKNRGLDPREHYAAALADYAEALALDARSVVLWRSRAAARQALSVFARLRGDPWRELLDGAREDFDRALELEPRSTWIFGLRAQNGLLLAGCLVQDGEDPADAYRRIVADYDAVLAAEPSPFARVERADARIQWAEYEHALGRDAGRLLAPAREDLETARAEAEGTFGFWVALGRLETLEGRRSGGAAHLERACSALEKSAQLNPGATEAHMRLGMARHLQGSVHASRGEDPEPAWEAAEAAFRRAPEINARWEQVWLGRGRLRLDRAARRGAAMFADAVADLAQVVEVNPAYVEGWMSLAEGKRRRAESAGGEEPDRAALESAIADAGRAVLLGPNHPAARLERARIRAALGDAAGAAEDADWVEARVPAWAEACAAARRGPQGR